MFFFDDIKKDNDNQRWRLERNAEQVVNDLITWLEEDMSEEPFFMWAHFYDAHHPHQVPDDFEHNFSDIYDAEISYVDYHIGRLRDVAENVAGSDNITWIITADHGEAFGEHKENGHGLFVWNTTMQVPLIIKPSTNWMSRHSDFQPGHIDSKNTVSGVDIAPTILSLVDMNNKLPNIDGVDISTTLEQKEIQRDFVYMESTQPQVRFGYHPEIAVVGDGLKLFETPSPHLYSVREDINEDKNIILSTPSPQKLKGKGKEIFLLTSDVESQSGINNQVVDQLAALGYISNDFDQSEISNIDAKDKIGTISKIELIRKLQKKSLEAKENRDQIEDKIEIEYLNLLEKEPQIAEARIGLASLYTRQKKYVKAIEVYEAALKLQPQSSVLRLNMANVYAEMGSFEKGIDLLKNLLEQVPTDQQAQASLLKMNIDSKNLSQALVLGKDYLQQAPQNRELQALVGIALVRSQQFTMAHQLLMASTQDNIPRQYVFESIAKLNIARNQIDEGLTYLLKEFEFFPTAEIARLIGNIYSGKKEYNNASSYYKQSIELTKNPTVRVQYAQSLFNEQKYKEAEIALTPLISKGSKNPNVLLLQANIYAKTQRYDEGVKIFEKAKTLLEKNEK